MKRLIYCIFIFFFVQCRSKADNLIQFIEQKNGVKISTVYETKSYNINRDAVFEKIIVYSVEKGIEKTESWHLAVVQNQENKNLLLRDVDLQGVIRILKLSFIKNGFDYSHILLVVEKDTGIEMHILDDQKFVQVIPLNKEYLKDIYLEDSAGGEKMVINNEIWKFDSFCYNHYAVDEAVPFLEKIENNGEDSWIILKNVGAFSQRAFVTLEFPGYNDKSLSEAVELKFDIPNVQYLEVGSPLHMMNGSNSSSLYPSIEVMKEPFVSDVKIRLPVKIHKFPDKMFIRVAYIINNVVKHWPDARSNNVNCGQIKKGQQGYDAFVYQFE